jgi:EF-hand domain
MLTLIVLMLCAYRQSVFMYTHTSCTVYMLQSGTKASANSSSVSAVESRLLRVITRAAAKGVSIAETFSAFDKDGNGCLTTTEFKQVLLCNKHMHRCAQLDCSLNDASVNV